MHAKTIEMPIPRIPTRNEYIERHERHIARREQMTKTRNDLPAIAAIEQTLPANDTQA